MPRKRPRCICDHRTNPFEVGDRVQSSVGGIDGPLCVGVTFDQATENNLTGLCAFADEFERLGCLMDSPNVRHGTIKISFQ